MIRKISITLISCLLILTSCHSSTNKSIASPEALTSLLKEHEPIIDSLYTADPSAHVFDNTLYLYTSHDPDILPRKDTASSEGGQYQMTDYHVLSIDGLTGIVTDHGISLSLEAIPWASKQLWAPDAAYKDGTYYLYFPAKDDKDVFRIGVATSDTPEGPFVAEELYIHGSYSIDPAVFVEDTGEAYMVFGGIWGGQLETYTATGIEPLPSEPALGPRMARLTEDMLHFDYVPFELSILDADGSPILAGDHDRRFFEAPWIHQYNGTYYLSYSTGDTHYLVYATANNIEGPYTYKGRLLEPVEGWTTHHSIVAYNNDWYLFYHDASLSGGVDQQRSVKYCLIDHQLNNTIVVNPPATD